MVYVVNKVWATTFEPMVVAFKPYDQYQRNHMIVGCALPFNFPDCKSGKVAMPDVYIFWRGRTAKVPLIDVGPHNKFLPYWRYGRPEAETQFANKTVAQNGIIPANPAGIDLTPEALTLIGVDRSVAYGLNYSLMLDAIAVVEFDGQNGVSYNA